MMPSRAALGAGRALSLALSAIRPILIIVVMLALVGLVAMFGTIQAMEKGNPPMQYRVLLSGATNCGVRVTWPVTNEFKVSKTGEAFIDIPGLNEAGVEDSAGKRPLDFRAGG